MSTEAINLNPYFFPAFFSRAIFFATIVTEMEDTFDRRLDNLLQAIQLHKTILSGQFPSTPENKFNAAKSLLMQTVDHKRHLVTKCTAGLECEWFSLFS